MLSQATRCIKIKCILIITWNTTVVEYKSLNLTTLQECALEVRMHLIPIVSMNALNQLHE